MNQEQVYLPPLRAPAIGGGLQQNMHTIISSNMTRIVMNSAVDSMLMKQSPIIMSISISWDKINSAVDSMLMKQSPTIIPIRTVVPLIRKTRKNRKRNIQK
jgi:hypothetical protein